MNTTPNMMNIIEVYIEAGWTPCPVKTRAKQPIYPGWPQTDRSEALNLFEANPGCNIGIVLGDASNGIVDVDLDDMVAVKVAPTIMPDTGVRFGRASKPTSHYIYDVVDAGRVERFKHPKTGAMLVELRGNGHYTVFPGSIHPSGEVIKFDEGVDIPHQTSWEELRRGCALVAVATATCEAWRQGSRHGLALALAGFLATAGVSRDNARRVILAITTVTQDDEAEDRMECVETTYNRHGLDQGVEGRAALKHQLGEECVQAFGRWLGLPETRPQSIANSSSSEVRVSTPSEPVILDGMVTDVDAAKAFADATSERLIYVDDKTWFAANNNVFEPVSQVRVVGLGIDFINMVSVQAKSEYQSRVVRGLKSSPRIKAMIDLAKPELWADSSKFDQDHWQAGCHGGVLDLCERRLVTPKTIVTKRLGTTFDPDAACPNFERFLGQIFKGDAEAIRFVKRAVGYTLTGRTTEQCLFVLIGKGANGKSTLLRLLDQLLGDYAGSTPMHTLMQSRYGSEKTYDLAALRGKRFVAAQEGEAGERLAEAKIKLMTGGDPITCRPLYSPYETFVPQFKLWLATNELPRIMGTGEAIWRRIHVIEFPVTIPPGERDPNLFEKLVAELPGILNWALEGLAEWNETGLNPPEGVTKATGEYRGESDTVRQFLQVCCAGDEAARTSVRDLHNAYAAWCDQGGLDALPINQFGKELGRFGLELVKLRAGNYRKGVRLRN